MTPNRALTFKQETQNGLDYLANHDIKAVAYLIFAGEETVSSTGLAKAVKSRLGVDLRFIGSYPETYHKGGFAEVTPGPIHCGRTTKLFSNINQDDGLAAVGATLDWSERHDISLIFALSSTASRGSKSPVNTIQLLHGLLNGLNIGEITSSRYKNTKEGWNTNYNTRFKQLVDSGIVISKDQETYFKILDPEYKGVPPLSSLSQVQQNIYTILKIAKKIDGNPDRKWGLGEIENLAKEIGIINTRDPKSYEEFHKRLIRVISKAHPKYSPGAIDKVSIAKRHYEINPIYLDAAADLVETAIQVDRSPTKKFQYINKAKEIYLEDTIMHRIINRGLINSPYINAKR